MAPVLDEAKAGTILESLLRNVYRPFDFREESDVYDKLATSAPAGPPPAALATAAMSTSERTFKRPTFGWRRSMAAGSSWVCR